GGVRGAAAASARGVLPPPARRPAARGDRSCHGCVARDGQVAALLRTAAAARAACRPGAGGWGMTDDCKDPARPLAAADTAGHLRPCATCRDTAATLARVRRAAARDDGPDLWARLRARLAALDAHVALVPPRFTWAAAAALGALVAAPLLVDE